MKIKLKRIRLTKISDDEFQGNHPNGINAGYIKEGFFTDRPEIGECFYVDNFRTSRVTYIIDDETFQTENSTYRLEYLD